jgi:hypothetical protein
MEIIRKTIELCKLSHELGFELEVDNLDSKSIWVIKKVDLIRNAQLQWRVSNLIAIEDILNSQKRGEYARKNSN